MKSSRSKEKKSNSKNLRGTLFVVATPIGNQLDWTERAKQVLKAVDIIAAEDTRVLKKELAKVGISPKKVYSYHDHNEDASTKGLLTLLAEGNDVALASDAGTPLINDPGYKIINAARKEGFNVSPIPGASSLTAALSVAALGGNTFFFGGFLPSQRGARQQLLKHYKTFSENLVFFESPHRLREMLDDAEEVFGGNTPTVVCRELTKAYEETKALPLSEIRSHFQVNEPRGEFVILLKGASPDQLGSQDTEKEVSKLLNEGFSASDILERLQSKTSLSRKQLYDLISRLKKLIDPA